MLPVISLSCFYESSYAVTHRAKYVLGVLGTKTPVKVCDASPGKLMNKHLRFGGIQIIMDFSMVVCYNSILCVTATFNFLTLYGVTSHSLQSCVVQQRLLRTVPSRFKSLYKRHTDPRCASSLLTLLPRCCKEAAQTPKITAQKLY